MSEKKQCFVIMPFSKTSEDHTEEYWTNHFELFLKPAIEKSGKYQAKRSEPLRGDIVQQIINALIRSPLVVADLTDFNPNVFWELGVRQSFKHGTITIAEEKTKIPFDMGSKGMLFYHPKSHTRYAEFMNDFLKAIDDCNDNPGQSDSAVLDAISGRGTFYQLVHRDESIRRVNALKFECSHNRILAEFLSQKINKKEAYAYIQFQICCLDLLLSHRYLDASTEFYNLTMRYYRRVSMYNSAIQSCRDTNELGDVLAKNFRHMTNETGSWNTDLLQVIDGLLPMLDKMLSELQSLV